MATAMTRTTTAAASTMEAIAATKPSKVAKSRRHTAKNVSAWIPKENLEEHALASAGLTITLEMATAMTRTTTAAASTMEAIAATKPSKVAKSRRHTAKNVSAWIPTERDRKSHASASAEMLKQKKMANVTTRTTIVGVNTMGVIAAPNPTKKRSTKQNAKNVCAWIPKTNQHAIRITSASLPNTLKMATAMTRTTNASATTMEAIAAPKPSTGAQSRRNTARRVHALIQRDTIRLSMRSRFSIM